MGSTIPVVCRIKSALNGGPAMAEEFEIVDIWLCRFPSVTAADAYFAKTYGDDDRPISQFAADMGERFYDHDFMEQGRFHDPPVNDLAKAVARHSFSSSYSAEVVEGFRLNPFAPFNIVLMMCNREIERQCRLLSQIGRYTT